jgi:hypothetical protein
VGQRPLCPGDIDADLVPPAWRPAVYANRALPVGAVDRDAYVVCVLEQLFQALKRRDVFASPSQRWSDPRARLLDGPRWEAVRHDVLAGLSLAEPVGEHLASRCRGLDAAWRQMAQRLAEAGPDAKVEVVVPPDGGRARSSVDKLGALDEPASLAWLRETTAAMLPPIDLPDLLFEVHSWTGFLHAFTHVSTPTGARPRVTLAVSWFPADQFDQALRTLARPVPRLGQHRLPRLHPPPRTPPPRT